MKKGILLLIYIILINISLFCENINGNYKGSLSLADENTQSISLEEIVSIEFDKESSFLEGIEVKIEVPKELQKYRNSFALYMFKNTSPVPDESSRYYKGTRIFMRLLPVQNNIYIKIPAVEDNILTQSADSILIPGFTPRNEYPLLATIIPIMKGIPSSVFDYSFKLTCKPIYSPKGSLSINISSTDQTMDVSYEVLIDNEKVKWPSDNYILAEGLHQLLINSSSGISKDVSIVISAGERQNIDLIFEYMEPEIKIEAPESALIILDGEELIRKDPESSINLEPGEHTIIFNIDGYQFSRDFTVESGDNFTISLALDVLIHKN